MRLAPRMSAWFGIGDLYQIERALSWVGAAQETMALRADRRLGCAAGRALRWV